MLGRLPKIRRRGNGDAGKMEMRDGHFVLKYVVYQQRFWPGCHFRQRYLIRGARGKYARPITKNSSAREWRCRKNGNARRAFRPKIRRLPTKVLAWMPLQTAVLDSGGTRKI